MGEFRMFIDPATIYSLDHSFSELKTAFARVNTAFARVNVRDVSTIWVDELSRQVRSAPSLSDEKMRKLRHLQTLYSRAKVRRDKVQMSSLEKEMMEVRFSRLSK